jgi:hypothetical protein
VISPSGHDSSIGIFVISRIDCVKAFAWPVSPLNYIVSGFWLVQYGFRTQKPLHSTFTPRTFPGIIEVCWVPFTITKLMSYEFDRIHNTFVYMYVFLADAFIK